MRGMKQLVGAVAFVGVRLLADVAHVFRNTGTAEQRGRYAADDGC